MLTVIVAVGLAELEGRHPGFIDGMLERLGEEALRTAVIKLRGIRAAPLVIEAQQDAYAWLATLAPLLRDSAQRPKRKRRRA